MNDEEWTGQRMDDDWRTGEHMMFEYVDKIARRRMLAATARVDAATNYNEFTAAYVARQDLKVELGLMPPPPPFPGFNNNEESK